MKHQSTLPSDSIGLNPDKIDDANFNEAVYKYVARQDTISPPTQEIRKGVKKIRDAPYEPIHTEGSAPIPKGTVGEANALRRRILQMSIAPNIYMNKHLKIKSPSRLG